MFSSKTHSNLMQIIPLFATLLLITACGSAQTEERHDLLDNPTSIEGNTPIQITKAISVSLTPPPNTMTPDSDPNSLKTPGPEVSPNAFPDTDSPLYDDGLWTLELGSEGVFVMNHDKSGRTLVVPYEPELTSTGASDRWFDYEIGSIGWTAVRIGPGQESGAAPLLLLLKLPEVEIVLEQQILSQEHCIRMRKQNDDGFLLEVVDNPYVAIHGHTFGDSMAWDSDGERLAFVAALDGPSADVYMYNTKSEVLIRLTDGPYQPYLNGWSPDGHWVVHQEVLNIWLGKQGVEYEPIALWAASASGTGSVHVLSVDEPTKIMGWTSSTRFVVFIQDFDYGTGFRLQLVDLYSGVVSTYFPGYFYAWAIDPVTGTVAFAASSRPSDPEGSLGVGLYLVSPDNRTPFLVGFSEPEDEEESGLVKSVEWLPVMGVFKITTRGDEVFHVTTEGRAIFCDDC